MRLRMLVAAAMFALATPACAQVSPPVAQMGPEWQLPLASIDERMLAFQEEAHILGMVWGVVTTLISMCLASSCVLLWLVEGLSALTKWLAP